ncbi:MAG: hypothetical protein IJJ42_08705 [Clostridia bacterium]|nr:hypothetical protein [Clostridia bacterium]
MKKLIAVLLVLAMMVMTTAVFAEAVGSKTSGDISGADVIDVKGNKEANIVIEIVEPDEAVTALQTAIAAAVEAGDLSSVLPADILAAIPADFLSAEKLADNLKEMVALKATGDGEGVESFTFGMELDTPYEEGEELCVLFNIIESGEWMMKDAVVKEGKVTITLNAEELGKILNKGLVATLVFNK